MRMRAFLVEPVPNSTSAAASGMVDDIARAFAQENFKDDPEAIKDQLSQVKRRAAAGYLEGFLASVLAIKANEAILSGKRIELKPDLYELS